jgi:hypothetical protein
VRWSFDESNWSDWSFVFPEHVLMSLASPSEKRPVIPVTEAVISSTVATQPKLCVSIETIVQGLATTVSAFVPMWLVNATSLPMSIHTSSGKVCLLR